MSLEGYDWLRTSAMRPERIEAAKRLGAVARDLGSTPGQIALAWCAANRNVSSVITGSSRPEQVVENMKAIDLLPKLTQEVMARIETATRSASDLLD